MKKLLFCLLMIVSMSALIGCSSEKEKSAGQYLYAVKDYTDTTIEFTSKPKRILPLGTGIPEILIDLVGPERVVAMPKYFDDDEVSFVADKAKRVKIKTERVIPVEGILKMKPDLVIAPYNSDRTKIETMRSVGLKVVVVKAPHNMQEIEQCVIDVSNAVGNPERGGQIVHNMKDIFALIERTNSQILPADRKKVLALSVEGAFGVKGGLFDDLCHYAVIKNAAGDISVPSGARINKEAVVKLQPDILILPAATRMMSNAKRKEAINEILHDPAYMTLAAVKNKQFIELQDKYYRYCVSHYAAKSAYVLAKNTYPDVYKNLSEPDLLKCVEYEH